VIILEKKYTKQEEFMTINDLDDDLKPITFKMPDIPNDRDIMFNTLQQGEQFFRRTEYPDRLKALMRRISREVEDENNKNKNTKRKLIFADEIHRELRKNKDKHEDIWRFIIGEWDRRLNGMWFFNNGVRTYISGRMYYWMNAWTIPEGKPDYRDRDRRYFHFTTEAFNDPTCFGILEMTRRKEGKSMRAACVLYEQASRLINRHCGIQSKNDTDAEDFFNKVVLGWKGMPFYFQPIHGHQNTDPKTIIRFSSGSGETQDQMELGSWIDFRAAKALAYDSTFLGVYVSDEEGKLEVVDAQERWAKVKPALMAYDQTITGKSIHTTTVEDAGKYGFTNFKKLWVGSSYHERNELGQTKTGLWRIFIPAYDGLRIDKFGMSLLRESKRELDIERASETGGSKNFYELLRKKPYTTKECFTINAGSCPFDKDILTKRVMYFFKGNKYLRRGDFIWRNGEQDTVVDFVDNETSGKFYVSYIPNEQQRNQYTQRGKAKIPSNTHLFTAGGDTFNFDITEEEGSKGGGAVFMGFNPIMESPLNDIPDGLSIEQLNDYYFRYKSNRFVCTYNHRPPTKEIYIDDMIKMCVFYGCYMFPEMNFTHIQDTFKRRGYAGYLLHKYDEKKQKMKDNAGDVTNDNSKDGLFMFFQEYILAHGQWEFHDELLEQCLRVEYDTMTDYDLFAAAAYALYGHSLRKHIIAAEQERKKKRQQQQKNNVSIYHREENILR
jgi:hypothetical protein